MSSAAGDLKVTLAFRAPLGASAQKQAPDAPERKYAFRMVRQRLHQATFREAVLSAYGNRCALTGMPEPRLLDAAHIVGDFDQMHEQPLVSNGLPLSKIHHAAFDANLIGIDPHLRVHASPALQSQDDGSDDPCTSQQTDAHISCRPLIMVRARSGESTRA